MAIFFQWTFSDSPKKIQRDEISCEHYNVAM